MIYASNFITAAPTVPFGKKKIFVQCFVFIFIFSFCVLNVNVKIWNCLPQKMLEMHKPWR